MHRVMAIVLLLAGLATGSCWGSGSEPNRPAVRAAPDPNTLDGVLQTLQDKAAALKSYQVNVDYIFKQPLLESQQRRKGVLYYAKFDDKSYLRIDFRTLQQDEEKEQAYLQQYLFDGVWLLEIDGRLKSAIRRQLTEPNDPIDALSLAGRHLPVLGLSHIEDLRQQFDMELIPQPQAPPTAPHHLHLKVKPDSVYQEDYVSLDFWIDRKIGLPVRVEAITPEEDAYEIRLTDPKVNVPLERKLFQVEIPRDFSKEVIPLDKSARRQPPK